jgi:hypothetical protein
VKGDRFFILLRGAVPLVLVALALLAGPTLLTWWLNGGPFQLSYLLIGGVVTVGLLAALGLALGWAVGRLGRGRRG